MGEKTGISWCDHTFNLWWGCWKIADECKNCYADATAHRYVSQFGELWGRSAARRFFGDKHWNELAKWNRDAVRDGVRRRVFVGSMCDWAEIHPDSAIAAQQDAARARLWLEIRDCRGLDFLMLTKRPESAAKLVPWSPEMFAGQDHECDPWPNVWLGVTAGTREAVRVNVPVLRSIPAVVHFISCEPILEHITEAEWDHALAFRHPDHHGHIGSIVVDSQTMPSAIDWLIVGDESGHGARPAQVDWVRTAREAAQRHGVAFHFKQWAGVDVAGIGGRLPSPGKQNHRRKIHLPLLDGKQWAQFPNGEKP